MKKFLLMATVLVLSLVIVSCGNPVSSPVQKSGNNPASAATPRTVPPSAKISDTRKDEIKGRVDQDPIVSKSFHPTAEVVKGFNRLDNPTGPIINIAVKNLTDKVLKISGNENSFYCNFLVVISQTVAGKELGRQSLSFTLQPNTVFSQNVLLVQSDETKSFNIISGCQIPPKIVGTYIPAKGTEGKVDVKCYGIEYPNGQIVIRVNHNMQNPLLGNWCAKATFKDNAGNILATSKDMPLTPFGTRAAGPGYDVIIGAYGYDVPKNTTNYTVTLVKK